VDAGAAIDASTRAIAQLNDDLAKIEAQLARRGLSAGERSELVSQAERLRQSIRANRDRRNESQESLATTPMVFQYGSGDLIPGFDTRSPIRESLEQAGNNFIGALAWIFVIAATLLPWLLLALAGWWLLQRWSRWLRRREDRRWAEPAAQPEPTGGE
jgi:Flp pilus assembly protein TadB